MEQLRRAYKWLGKGKDFLPYLAVAVALIYAVGWAVRYQAIAGLGVGPLEVPHETAITTSLALILSISPGVLFAAWLEWAIRNQSGNRIKFWCGQLLMSTLFFGMFGYLVLLMPLLLAQVDKSLQLSIINLLFGEWIFTLFVFGLRFIGKPYRLFSWLGLGILVFTYSRIFCNELLPKLPEVLGGLGQSKVILHLKDPVETVTGRWIASDPNAIIIVDGTQVRAGGPNGSFHSLRIPTNRVVDAESPGR